MSNTATEQVTVETEGMTLVIPDIKKPTWYGDYHHGKLAIYKTDVTRGAKPDSITVLSVYTDELGIDFVISASYEDHLTMEEITSHLCTNVILAYHRNQRKNDPVNYAPGTDTPQ